MAASAHLSQWTGAMVKAACGKAHNAYRAEKTASYRAYFAARRQLRADDHEYKAKDLPAALPDEWAGLSEHLPKSERHPQYLSGNSSQVLALGLLGVAAKSDPSLNWLWNGLSPLALPVGRSPEWQFERKVAPGVLNEQPRQTSIDFFVSDPAALLCIECKWTEAGIGACGCGPKAAKVADCSKKVLGRRVYWKTAYRGLPPARPRGGQAVSAELHLPSCAQRRRRRSRWPKTASGRSSDSSTTPTTRTSASAASGRDGRSHSTPP